MKVLNLNMFYPFERLQFENYLNDMAKKGYHLKKLNGIFNEYSHEEKDGYYHVGIHGGIRFFEESEDKNYIELFESDGYKYVDKRGLFYVFFSQKKDSIYTDKDIEEEMVLKKTKKIYLLKLYQ